MEIRMSRCGDKWAYETHSKMLPVFTGVCVEIFSFAFHCFLGKDLSRLKTQFQPFVKLPEDKQRALYKTLCELLLHEEMVTALGDVVRWRIFGLLPKSNFRIVLAFSFAWIFHFSSSFCLFFSFQFDDICTGDKPDLEELELEQQRDLLHFLRLLGCSLQSELLLQKYQPQDEELFSAAHLLISAMSGMLWKALF